MKQNTSTILMVRPVQFRFNEETAANNFYQKSNKSLSAEKIQKQARDEFDTFVNRLRTKGINVIVVDDIIESDTPDSIFPNNWVSFHANGQVGLYPMCAENRRIERRLDILENLRLDGFIINNLVDFTAHEDEGKFLEGTGSLVLDRENMVAYAALSIRTNKELILEFCDVFGYEFIVFTANQTVGGKRLPIYHTNVMMCVADRFAVVCLDSVDDDIEKQQLIKSLEGSGKEVIDISEEQVNHFAGNMLQLETNEGEKVLVMSTAAFQSLNEGQKEKLESYGQIIYSPLDTIEAMGGGSARCMIAEVFLQKNV